MKRPEYKDIRLPAVKSIHIEANYDLIAKSLAKEKLDLASLNWPEALKAYYRGIQKTKIELLHIKSCIDKALDENILPIEKEAWNLLLKYNLENEA